MIEVDDYYGTQLLFSSIEYDLYLEDRAQASFHASELRNTMQRSVKLYCDGTADRVTGLIADVDKYADQVLTENEPWSLEKLRDFKGQFILMQTDDDYDPYLYHVWRFEEEMYYTTKAAIDPMLDLYEWGEFKMMVDCMNEDWEMVKRHYPSIELFGSNTLGYKAQTMGKIHLQESINQFNIAVNSDDYITYDLCEHGERLREMYVQYIKTFVSKEESITPFIATL